MTAAQFYNNDPRIQGAGKAFPPKQASPQDTFETTWGNTFWVVWNPQHGPPNVRHATEEEAKAEATRIAQLHPSHEIFVLQATSRTVATLRTWTSILKA